LFQDRKRVGLQDGFYAYAGGNDLGSYIHKFKLLQTGPQGYLSLILNQSHIAVVHRYLQRCLVFLSCGLPLYGIRGTAAINNIRDVKKI